VYWLGFCRYRFLCEHNNGVTFSDCAMGACMSTSAHAKYASSSSAADCGATPSGGNNGVDLPEVHDGAIFDVAFAGDSHIATAGEDCRVVLTNWRSREICEEWTGHTKAVNRVVYGRQPNADGSCGRFVYSSSRDTTVCQWARGQAAPLARLEGHTMTVNAIDANDEETLLCSGSRDNTVRAWDLASTREVAKCLTPRNLVTCLKFVHGEPNCVAQGSEDLTLRIWDLRVGNNGGEGEGEISGSGSGSIVAAATLRGYQYFPLCMDVSVDGRYILTGSKGFNGVGCEGRLWDRRMGKVLQDFVGHTQDTVGCAFLPQSHEGPTGRVATVSKDQTLKIWDVATGELLESRTSEAGMFTSLAAAAPSKGTAVEGDVAYCTATFWGGVSVYDPHGGLLAERPANAPDMGDDGS